MKEIVMCNNNLRLKSPLTRSTDHYSLLKHRNFDFAHFLRGGVTVSARSKFWGGCQGRRTGVGVTTVSNSLILGGWVTKALNYGDKNRGVEGYVGDNNILTFSSNCTGQEMSLSCLFSYTFACICKIS